MPVIALMPEAEIKTQKWVVAVPLPVPNRTDKSRLQQAGHLELTDITDAIPAVATEGKTVCETSSRLQLPVAATHAQRKRSS